MKILRILAIVATSAMLFACDKPDNPEGGKDPGNTENPSNPNNPDIPDTPLQEQDGAVVYYENFDGTTVSGNKTYVDSTPQNWINATGSGSDGVTYGGFYVSVRNTIPSNYYNGASGKNNIYFSNATGHLDIGGITLPSPSKTYRFTAGMHYYQHTVTATEPFTITVSDEANVSSQMIFSIEYPGKGDYYLANCVFKVEGMTGSKLSIVITSSQKDARIDDIKIVETTFPATQTIKFSNNSSSGHSKWDGTPVYFEHPQTVMTNSNWKYVTHWANSVTTGKYVRNYSACYDTRRHNPMWVAFPMHSIYFEGGYTRPDNDPWQPDPVFETSEQSIIYPEGYASWPNVTTSQRSWESLSFGKYPTRGHMLASQYRGCGANNKKVVPINHQTFYPTNIYPEYYMYPKHHGKIEVMLRDNWYCSDTTYVVIGCYYGDPDLTVQDDNWSGSSVTGNSKDCAVPTATYRVFLRTIAGNTGKKVSECNASQLTAIGFWFEQSPYDWNSSAEDKTIRQASLKTVAEIEQLIGGDFKFFPSVPESVKTSYNIDHWTGLADVIDLKHSELPE